MKKIVYTLIFTALTVAQSFAQTDLPVVVGGAQKGEENATMEILSKGGTKGFMPPRLTTAQVTNLTTKLTAASEGLTVFNIDTDCLQYWKGAKWSDCSTYTNAELTFDCTASKLKGIYNVDKVTGDTEFIEVKVNVTKAGPLVLYSNTQNGVRFYLSTILDIGEHIIEVPAIGTPTTAGDFSYNLFDQSANTDCAGNDFKAVVVENNAAYTVDCNTAAVLSGVIMEGSAVSGQTLKIKVSVSKAGNYYIKSNTVYGLWLESSGVLNLGTTEIALELKGVAETVPGNGNLSFNLVNRNNVSVAQCAVSFYVSAEKAVFTADCNTLVFSGGVGVGTGAAASAGARLFYGDYVFTNNDYIKVKINVTRPGFIDIGTKPDIDVVAVGMMYTFAGYVDKIGVQDVYLRPVNAKIPFLNGRGLAWLDSFSYLYNNISKSDMCNFPVKNAAFNIDMLVGNVALGTYDPALNQTADQYLKNSIVLFTPIAPASGLNIKIKIQAEQVGVFSFKGTANGMTLESNQGVYGFEPEDKLADFKLYGTPNHGGDVAFPMFNTITGESAGTIIISMKEIFF